MSLTILISRLLVRCHPYVDICTIKGAKAIGEVGRIFGVVGDSSREWCFSSIEVDDLFIKG
jgi:hypothetical protein